MNKQRLCALCLLLALGLSASEGAAETRSANRAGSTAQTKADGSAASTAAQTKSNDSSVSTAKAGAMPTVTNQMEYALYCNLFQPGSSMVKDYLNKTAVKQGTFTRLTDAWSGVTRYYVWGYSDETKCCDWQWEFVPKDPDSLPANGSLVQLRGTLAQDEAALDKLWFIDAEVELLTPYAPQPCDIDMTTMGGTLERVQMQNMQSRSAYFQGKTLRAYGTVASLSAIGDPYTGSWRQELSTSVSLPSVGTMVIVSGKWEGDKIRAVQIETSDDY